MRIIVIILFLSGVYYTHTKIMEKMPDSEILTSQSASSVQKPDLSKRHYNGLTLLKRSELDFIGTQITKKLTKNDFSPISLADGTKIELDFKPNGRICPTSKLPLGTVSIKTKIAVVE